MHECERREHSADEAADVPADGDVRDRERQHEVQQDLSHRARIRPGARRVGIPVDRERDAGVALLRADELERLARRLGEVERGGDAPGGSGEVQELAEDAPDALALLGRPGEVLAARRAEPWIPPDQVGQIFRKYGRVPGQARATRYDTGLGLVFCKLATEIQGGTIRAESALGRGTTFVVELPAHPAGKGEDAGPPGSPP